MFAFNYETNNEQRQKCILRMPSMVLNASTKVNSAVPKLPRLKTINGK